MLADDDVEEFIARLSFDNHLSDYLLPVWESLSSEFSLGGIKSFDKLRLNRRGKMKNLRFRAITRNGLTLELDRYTTDSGEYHELEVETLQKNEARRDEYIHLLLAALDIPIVCPTDQLGRYPPKIAVMLHDANIFSLQGRLATGKACAEELIKKTHREACSTCQVLLES